MLKKSHPRLPEAEARRLSSQLYPLGEQCSELWGELECAGYGEPIRTQRQALRELAGSAEKYAQIECYWIEFAKERLAGLNGFGPVDSLRGQLPTISAYRSEFLEKLREDARVGLLKSEGSIVSPQIEPTLKRYVEMLPDDPTRVAVRNEIREARERAALALRLQEMSDFSSWSADKKYDALVARYRARLEPAGFSVGSLRKHGVVFRKSTSDARWSLVFVDESREGIRAGHGTLESTIAITAPGVDVVPRAVELRAAIAFEADVLIYGFRAACGFNVDSYAQLCLACDANAFLAQSVCVRIDKLLSHGR